MGVRNNSGGVRCDVCGHEGSRVIKTWRAGDQVFRRRQCEGCGFRFSTCERPVARGRRGGNRDGA